MRVYACYNLKGGVGKTATAVNLAHLSASEGQRTLLWDLDPQGSATFYFRVKPRVKGGAAKLIAGKTPLDKRIRASDFENLDLLPADFSYRRLDFALDDQKNPRSRLRKLLRTLKDDYDVILLDCAPSISLVSESVFDAADALLVPTIPTTLSVRTLLQIAEHIEALGEAGGKKVRKHEPVLLPFFCMVDRRKRLHREICDDPGAGGLRFLEQVVPYASDVEKMGLHRAPLTTFARSSAAAKAYRALWSEIRSRDV